MTPLQSTYVRGATSHMRGRTGGTLTRAKRFWPMLGSCTVTASESDRSLM